jgi:hypothetical protein
MTVKWSAFSAGTTISGTDVTVGLQGGGNVQWTWSQVKTYLTGGGTLAIASGKTFTASNTLTLTGTDITSFAFPSTSDTVAVLGIAQTFTAAQTIKRDGIGSSSTDGFRLRNTTAAAAGAQQYSPRSVWEGQGWKTTATAASQAVAFMAETRPVQGAANPSGIWALAASINGGAYSDVLTVTSAGLTQSPQFVGTTGDSLTVAQFGFGGSATGAASNTGLGYFSDNLLILQNGVIALIVTAALKQVRFPSDWTFSWASSTNNQTAADLALARDAANTLGLRNGANAQTFNGYYSYTDVSNYQRWALKTAAASVELAAEAAGTGAANIDVKLTPKGTGNVSFPGGVLLKTTAALTDGAGASAGTLANAPSVGNPTKWIPINDNGTTRYIPAW